MNEKQTQVESIFRHRWVASELSCLHDDFPVVVVTGPRQVGKSTLLRNTPPFSGYPFLDLDRLELQRRLDQDPGLAWRGRDRVVIDEVQRIPSLLSDLKAHADDVGAGFRAVISGSANLLLMKQVTESLAGRAATLHLQPFALGEWEGCPRPLILERLLSGELPEEQGVGIWDPAPEMIRGFLPRPRQLDRPQRWWEAYVQTYLERDLRQLAQVQSLPDFQRLLALLALHSAQVLNETALSRKLAVSQATVHRHIGLVEVSNLLFRLPAWTVNRGKRVTKRPKLHLADPGLAAFLAGLHSADEVREARESGALFESLVWQQLRVLASLMERPARLHHWRSSDGKEVDLVLSSGRKLLAFECKWTERPLASDARHLRLFRELHPECAVGVVVHAGSRIEHLGGGIVAIPWQVIGGVGR
jgi:predicted AAA+ superfamily ATPase